MIGFLMRMAQICIVSCKYMAHDCSWAHYGFRMSAHLKICKDKLLSARFQELVFEDALAVVQDRVHQVGNPKNELTLPEWEIVMRDEHMSNYIVMFLRLLTSAEIQLNREAFEPFILVRLSSNWLL